MSNILIIGDKIIDEYVEVIPKKISAEVPILVSDILERTIKPGGADNVRALFEQLGHRAHLVSGYNVEEIAPELKKPHLKHRTYPRKIRYMCDGYQMARYDENEEISSACECEYGKLLAQKDAADGQLVWDTIVVADYAKGSVRTPTIQSIVKHQNSRFVYVHTKRDPTEWLQARPTPPPIMFCNEEEYARYLDVYDHFELVVRTHGEAGAQIVRYGDSQEFVPAVAARVISTNGAGDSLMAGFIHEHISGKSPTRSLVTGVVAASITISRPYCGYIDGIEELNEQTRIHTDQRSSPEPV